MLEYPAELTVRDSIAELPIDAFTGQVRSRDSGCVLRRVELALNMDSAGRKEFHVGLKPGLSANLMSELKLRPPKEAFVK